MGMSIGRLLFALLASQAVAAPIHLHGVLEKIVTINAFDVDHLHPSARASTATGPSLARSGAGDTIRPASGTSSAVNTDHTTDTVPATQEAFPWEEDCTTVKDPWGGYVFHCPGCTIVKDAWGHEIVRTGDRCDEYEKPPAPPVADTAVDL